MSKKDIKDAFGERKPGPWATSVSFVAARNQVRLTLETGVELFIPRDTIEELADRPASHMRELTLLGNGEALASEADDVHIFVPGLVRDVVGFDASVKCWSDDSPGHTTARRRRRTAKR